MYSIIYEDGNEGFKQLWFVTLEQAVKELESYGCSLENPGPHTIVKEVSIEEINGFVFRRGAGFLGG